MKLEKTRADIVRLMQHYPTLLSKRVVTSKSQVLLDAKNYIYIVLEGSLETFMYDTDGRKIALYNYTPLQSIGFEAFPSENIEINAFAKEETKIVQIVVKNFLYLCEKEDWLKTYHTESCNKKLALLAERFKIMSMNHAPSRLASILLMFDDQARDDATDREYHNKIPNYNHAYLASYTGLSRETITRIICKWERKGWIERLGDYMELCDREKLVASV